MVVPSRHPWGAFKLGSWKKARVTSATVDRNGRQSTQRVTETTSTLVGVDRESYTLRVEAVVIVAGRRFTSAPRYIRRGFDGEGDDEVVSYDDVRSESVAIGEEEIPSRVQRIVAEDDGTRRVSLVNFSPEVSPFVLRKSTVTYDRKTDSRIGQTVLEVLRTAMPHTILSKRRLVSQIKTVSTHPDGRCETIELYSPDVPGGVVEHEAREFDENGRLTETSTLTLIGYGIGDGRVEEGHRPRFFRVFRRRRR